MTLRRITRAQARTIATCAITGDRSRAAAALGISRHTVRGHLAASYEALDVTSLSAALYALGWTCIPYELLDLPESRPSDDMLTIAGVA